MQLHKWYVLSSVWLFYPVEAVPLELGRLAQTKHEHLDRRLVLREDPVVSLIHELILTVPIQIVSNSCAALSLTTAPPSTLSDHACCARRAAPTLLLCR